MKHPPSSGYTPEEQLLMIAMMRSASNAFYVGAQLTGNHAFLEFTGLMNEYISLCEQARAEGIDFTTANVHGGVHLPFKPYHLAYLNEKLECIYGVKFQITTPLASMEPPEPPGS